MPGHVYMSYTKRDPLVNTSSTCTHCPHSAADLLSDRRDQAPPRYDGAMPTRKPKRKPGAQLGEDVARGMVMAAGARVFATKGIRDTSVEDLLEAANVSRRTFYRLYQGKEDVALALYVFGTNQLIDRWKLAIAAATGTLDAFTRCIDVFIMHAAMLGPLIFVLGGEATRQESPLHKRRMEVHDTLVDMMRAADPELANVDPLLVRATLFALEAVTRHILTEGDQGRRVSPAALERGRKVMNRIVTAGFAGSGDGVAPMPLAP
jgi:AcrR family transcriptional regulator